jgi:hypothetical protein
MAARAVEITVHISSLRSARGAPDDPFGRVMRTRRRAALAGRMTMTDRYI